MLYESCACPGGRLGPSLVNQSCFRSVLRTSPGETMRALMRRVRSRIISAPRLSPKVWCAPLGPFGPAASHWLDNSQIQRLDPEKSPENHRRAIHITEVGPMKRIPSANYSLSIAVQENALRVMCLTRGTPGSASGEPGLLQRRPAHQPW